MLDQTQLPTPRQMTDAAYRLFAQCDYGARITYAELTEACGLDATVTRTRAAILRAGRRLLKDANKLVINVRGVGYQIALPSEHVSEFQRQRRGIVRRTNRAANTVVYVRLEGMSAEEVNKVLTEQTRAAMMRASIRKLHRAKELPAPKDVHIPSGKKLVAMLTAKRA